MSEGEATLNSNLITVERGTSQLSRGIKEWHVSLIALGGIIGSCYFLQLGATYASLGPGAVMITYGVAGLTIFGVMQAFAELLVNLPRRGSFVSYAREFLGDTVAAGIGWAFWANWVCYIPSEALATAIFTNNLLKDIFGVEPDAAHAFLWGALALALLTAINLCRVGWFGHVESVMAIMKILAIALFVICGLCVWLGLAASGERPWGGAEGFIGTGVLLSGGGSAMEALFPNGGFVMATLMIYTLVNYQGSEIVGLSAAETKNPEVTVPAACNKVAVRVILIYLAPILVLTLIMPYFEGSIEKSVFADALYRYGFAWGSRLFTAVTLIAAFSCANSGFYGTVRSLYGLSVEGLAPKFLSKLNRFNTPQNATLFTLAPVWLVFVLGFGITELGWWGGDMPLYTALVGISGFTGTLCWVGIILSQIFFRRKLAERGYDVGKSLKLKAKWQPWLGYFSLALQGLAMIMLVFEKGGRDVFLLSVLIIATPMLIHVARKRRGRSRTVLALGDDEFTFDERFPDTTGK